MVPVGLVPVNLGTASVGTAVVVARVHVPIVDVGLTDSPVRGGGSEPRVVGGCCETVRRPSQPHAHRALLNS